MSQLTPHRRKQNFKGATVTEQSVIKCHCETIVINFPSMSPGLPILICIFLANIVHLSYAQPACKFSNYSSAGEGCKTNAGTKELCEINLMCDPTTAGDGICKVWYEGDACNTNQDCGGIYPDCIDNQCSHKRYAGDNCTKNEDCWSGLCTNQQCEGISVELPCDPTAATCNIGLFCNAQGQCQAPLWGGEQCSGQQGGVTIGGQGPNAALVCVPGYYCDTTIAKCTQYRSLGLGSACSDTLGCSSNLVCTNSVCRDPSTGVQGQTCQADSDCGMYSLCNCSVNGTAECTAPIYNFTCNDTSFFECLQTHFCPYTDWGPWVIGTCAHQYCQCQLSTYLNCFQNTLPPNVSAPLPNYTTPIACSMASFNSSFMNLWASLLGVITFLLVFNLSK